jgi:uncharacterized lipoprotein YbaY
VEPASLSSGANAVVVLVAGTGTPNTDTIAGSQVVSPVGQQPIPFRVPFKSKDIDPDLTYTIQAQVQDGDHTWQTSGGVHVLTQGNPKKNVPVPLAYQADLLKGEVTGQITGVGVELEQGAYSGTALVRVDTGEIVGIDTSVNPGSVPIPFLLAFDPADIDPSADYVVEAKIVSGDRTWMSAIGTPVITMGNPLTDVTVSVAEKAAEPEASPAAADIEDEGGTPLWLILLVVALAVGLIVAVVGWLRSRKSPPGRHGAPPVDGGPGEPPGAAGPGEPPPDRDEP